MRPRRISPDRRQGEWTALVDGVRIAVIHDRWWKPPSDYFDPMNNVKLDGAKYRGLVTALAENDVALMQKSDQDFRSQGYVGMFRYQDLAIEPSGAIKLRIVGRLPVVI